MAYFQELKTCADHGFVLSHEGTCIRCRQDADRADRRIRFAKLSSRGVIFVVTLLGVGVAWGRMGSDGAQHAAASEGLHTVALSAEPGRAESSVDEPRFAMTDTPATYERGAWDVEMERADQARQAAAAAQVAAEKRQIRAAVALPSAGQRSCGSNCTSERVVANAGAASQAQAASTALDHPSWWNDTTRASYPRGRGVYSARVPGMPQAGPGGTVMTGTSSPAAWGLPANNGGNFANRNPGRSL
jgi:hypothetical protein